MKYSAIDNYRKNVACGYGRMKGLNVAICSIVRDCEKALKRNIPAIEELRKSFLESVVIVVENDSKDRTKEVLRSWSSNSNDVFVISKDFYLDSIPAQSGQYNPCFSRRRVESMARYRNMYLDFFENKFDVDYLIVIDLDLYFMSLDGIANTFGQPIEWHAVSSNGKNVHSIFEFYRGYKYYDTYAFRECGDVRTQTEEMIYTYQDALKALTVGMPMIKVNSAFCGLAVYDAKAVRGIRYSGCNRNDDGRVEVECEHVAFHREMIRRKQELIFINPSQIVYYDTYAHYINTLIRERLGKYFFAKQ